MHRVNILLSLVVAIASVCVVTQIQTVQGDSPISPAELWLSARASTNTLVDLSVTGRTFNSTSFPLGWSIISDPVGIRRSCLRTNGQSRLPLLSTVLNISYTITAWIQPSIDSNNYSPYILSTDYHSNYGVNYGYFSLALSGVYTLEPPPGWTYQAFEVRQTVGGTEGQPVPHGWVSSGYPFAAGTWQHVAVTYDATTRVKTIYQQGSPINSITHTSTEMASWNGSSDLYLGCLAVTNGATCSWAFRGCMDEIKIYNQPLTPDQIKATYLASTL